MASSTVNLDEKDGILLYPAHNPTNLIISTDSLTDWDLRILHCSAAAAVLSSEPPKIQGRAPCLKHGQTMKKNSPKHGAGPPADLESSDWTCAYECLRLESGSIGFREGGSKRNAFSSAQSSQ
jgi:hypothetical protein